eukprot:4785808-Amphidinium_carterae.1
MSQPFLNRALAAGRRVYMGTPKMVVSLAEWLHMMQNPHKLWMMQNTLVSHDQVFVGCFDRLSVQRKLRVEVLPRERSHQLAWTQCQTGFTMGQLDVPYLACSYGVHRSASVLMVLLGFMMAPWRTVTV